ncbi:MAG: ABC-2 family transporter protein [Candidatus Kuenenbacteria bacterium]
MKEIRLATKIIKTLIKDCVQYPNRLIVDTIAIIARCGILLILYWYVFKLRNGIINDTTFLFVAWSIFFYFSFSILRLRDISREIMKDVQTGNIETLFSKPISYLLYRMWWQIGSGIYSFVVITILATIVLFFIIGLPSTMTIGIFIPTLILTFICGVILSLFLYTIVGLLSFWIEDITPIYWIVDKAVMILGGSYLPVALFPDFMFKIALWSPFGASQFVTHTVYKTWQTNWYQLIGIQLFWIILLGLIIYFMFKKAKKKVSVNGG